MRIQGKPKACYLSIAEEVILFVIQIVFPTLGAFLGSVLNFGNPESFFVHLQIGGMSKSALPVLANNHERQKIKQPQELMKLHNR